MINLNNSLSSHFQFLDRSNISYLSNVNLRDYSYFKTGGSVQLIIFPSSLNEMTSSLSYLYKKNIKFKIIGSTSNLLFLDDITYSCFVCTSKLKNVSLSEKMLVADVGAMLPDLSRFCLSKSITGFEGFEGIPGTVGAAVFMNAGAYGYEIKDVLIGVDVVNLSSFKLSYISVAELELSNRSSYFRSNPNKFLIYKCYFKIKFCDNLEIYKKMSLFHSKRHKYQEFMFPTLGSLYSGSIYRELAKKSFVYRVISGLHFLIFYKLKLAGREAPNDRYWLNTFTIKFFKLRFKNQPFSDKDLNTLTNRGQHTDEFLDYINQLENYVCDLSIENEIVYP